jgi:RES domain-containing protein
MATVYRIGSAGPDWDESDLEGKGAKATGGRWNNVGSPMLYCGSSIALAVLETIVHLGAGVFPMNRYIIEIRIPDDEFVKRRIVSEKDLPDAWNSRPVSFKSKDFGTNWIKGNTELVMQVPSVIVPLEWNFLLNPLHPGMVKVSATNLGQYVYDPRNVPGSAMP